MAEIQKDDLQPADKTNEGLEMNLVGLEKQAKAIMKAIIDISRLTTSEIVKQIEAKSKDGKEYAFRSVGTNTILIYKKDTTGRYSTSEYLSISVDKPNPIGPLSIQISKMEGGVKRIAGTITCDKSTCTSEDGELVLSRIRDLIHALLVPEIKKQDEAAQIAEQDSLDKKEVENKALNDDVKSF